MCTTLGNTRRETICETVESPSMDTCFNWSPDASYSALNCPRYHEYLDCSSVIGSSNLNAPSNANTTERLSSVEATNDAAVGDSDAAVGDSDAVGAVAVGAVAVCASEEAIGSGDDFDAFEGKSDIGALSHSGSKGTNESSLFMDGSILHFALSKVIACDSLRYTLARLYRSRDANSSPETKRKATNDRLAGLPRNL